MADIQKGSRNTLDLNIYTIRGQSVVLDSDLAAIYDVSTKVLNQALKRNTARFPEEFAFQLTNSEWISLRSQFVTSKARGGRQYCPWVFTEHGALMSSMILKSDNATAMSVYVVRAFVKMRERIRASESILIRLLDIEKSLLQHDQSLWDLYQKLLPLLQPPPLKKRRRAGFDSEVED